MTPPDLPPQIRERTLAKARTLIEALPFMQEHWGKVVVIKYGGAAMNRAPLSRSFAEDVSLLQHAGIHPIVVHGGGPQVTELSERLGLQARFVDGVRVTDGDTLDVATMVLAGKLNTRIVGGSVPASGGGGVDRRRAGHRRRRDPVDPPERRDRGCP